MSVQADKISIHREMETVTVPAGCFAMVMPVSRAFPARVALQPHQAGQVTSEATKATRAALISALLRAEK